MDCELPTIVDGIVPARPVRFAMRGHDAGASARFPALLRAGARHSLSELDLARAHGKSHHRLEIGNVAADLRYFAQPTATDHPGAARRARILVSLNGDLAFSAGAVELISPARVPMLLSCSEHATAWWPADSWGLVIDLPRDGVNAAVSAALGDARRLASMACILGDRTHNDCFDLTLEYLINQMSASGVGPCGDLSDIEAALCSSLARLLIAQDQSAALLTPVRSVSQAMRLIRDDHRRDFDTEVLAVRVGVTAQTLRKGFRSCLGLSVKAFVQIVRLEWAHGTLSSGFDGRSIEDIAKDAGFSGAPPFSRAYVKHFGEPPSQTRGRAVRATKG